MILFNVTIILDDEIQNEWLNWMKTKQIPDVMNTGCFVSNRMLKVVDSPNEGVTYCVQYISDSLENLNEFRQKHDQLIWYHPCRHSFHPLYLFQKLPAVHWG